MPINLLRDTWTDLDSAELRLLLDRRFGGPGQHHDSATSPNRLYLPLADSTCRVVLTFDGPRIVAIERGEGFRASEWDEVSEEIERSILSGLIKVGRDYSFSTFRVSGYWRGERSGVQILTPPANAPRASVESAEHPFILEFPVKVADFGPITNHRRLRDHRKLTLLLNVLLAGRTSLQPRRSRHFWAYVPVDDGSREFRWVQEFYFAELGKLVIDDLSSPGGERIEEVEPEEYYSRVRHDGKCLRVPADLDDSICLYFRLSAPDRERFDRATFWADMAARQWHISVSASFAALVSAIESLTQRGDPHPFRCPVCGEPTMHETPGAGRRFRDFLDDYAGGAALASQRSKMYSLRSGILHGSKLMLLDLDLAFGWDPPWWNESELHSELWALTQIALRNWLRRPRKACST